MKRTTVGISTLVLAATLLPALSGCSKDEPNAEQSGSPNAQSGADAAAEAALFEAGLSDYAVTWPEIAAPELPCNGVPGLCAHAFTDTSVIGTHHSAIAGSLTWLNPAQVRVVPEQLADAVRALWLEVHVSGGSLVVCRGDCAGGSEFLNLTLDDVRAFLAVNPREIIAFVVFGQVPSADLAGAFATAKLDGYAIAHDRAQPWPTLNEMVESGKRIVVLSDGPAGGPAWVLPIWDHAFATAAGSLSTLVMDCSIAHGTKDNAIFIVNHFLGVDPGPDAPLADAGMDADTSAGVVAEVDAGGAAVANAAPFFADRVRRCQQQYGRRANLVFVDDYEAGNVVTVLRGIGSSTP